MNQNQRQRLRTLTRFLIGNHFVRFILVVQISGFSCFAGRASFTQEPVLQQADEKSDRGVIVNLTRELDSNIFDRRERASRELIAIGQKAIPVIEELMPQGSAEAKLRCIYVLQTMSLADSVSLHTAAAKSLAKMQTSDDLSIATKAVAAMKYVTESRARVALSRLKELGAEVQMVPLTPIPWTIRFGDQWKGTNEDLRRLEWIFSVREIEFDGKMFDDESLAQARLVSGLYSISLKRCSITDSGLEVLAEMEDLSTISIHYCAVTDACIEALRKVEYASLYRLFGTKITREAAMSLADEDVGVEVDYRRGALLGVACLVGSDRCQVSTVEPESSAEKAGIRVGDVITHFDDKPVANISELTAVVGTFEAGNEAEVKWLRGTAPDAEEMQATIKLGSW